MRIIRGKFGRRRFDVPTNITARPTTDFARENIFNVPVSPLLKRLQPKPHSSARLPHSSEWNNNTLCCAATP